LIRNTPSLTLTFDWKNPTSVVSYPNGIENRVFFVARSASLTSTEKWRWRLLLNVLSGVNVWFPDPCEVRSTRIDAAALV
jgi:hypothetical protein